MHVTLTLKFQNREENTMVCLHRCTGSSEPSKLADAISNKISHASSIPHLKVNSTMLTLCMLGNFSCSIIVCSCFFISGTVFRASNGLDQDQDRQNLILIWIQTVSKGNQQMRKVTASKKRVKIGYYDNKIKKTIPCLPGAT